jgi:hypothetical protein
MTETADRRAQVLRHPDEEITAETISYASGSAAFVEAGTTEHFQVEYQRHLGYAGQVLARGVLGACEADFAQLTAWFNGLVPQHLPFRVSIVRGSFGAFHDSCADTHLHCAAFDGHNAELVEMVAMAEAVEVFSAAQNAGWNCGASNGEGLSRVLSSALHPTQLDGFATAGDWLNSRRQNYVDHSEGTDVDPMSTGCATLFLNYLHHQLGHPWAAIVAHGHPTLAATYHALQNRNDGWEQFSTLLAAHYPPGHRSHVATDNVFPLPDVATPADRAT